MHSSTSQARIIQNIFEGAGQLRYQVYRKIIPAKMVFVRFFWGSKNFWGWQVTPGRRRPVVTCPQCVQRQDDAMGMCDQWGAKL